MTREIGTEERNVLEQAIDHHGLSAMLEAIGEIAYEKAQHIAENWQDKALARVWTRASNKILTARDAARKEGL